MTSKGLGDQIKVSLAVCLESLKKDFPSIEATSVHLEIPKEKTHGDLSTNLAFKLSRHLKENPNKIAERIIGILRPLIIQKGLSTLIEKVEAKPPGFINFYFGREYLYGVLAEIEKKGKRYGSSDIGKKKKLQIEFVSANPTGPLTIAHGRQAAVGDSLANILAFVNYNVKREYYINDEGNQIDLLGKSIRARYQESVGKDVSFPENGYKGEYITGIAEDIKKKHGAALKDADTKCFTDAGLRTILKSIKNDLNDFGVKFDVWYSQKSLTKRRKIKKTLEYLKKKGHLYEKDGALWFKSTDLGDDKDRVVIKSDGSFTYLAPDMAYHDDKFKRGFKRVINIWGPDHHGYIARLKAAVKALGHNDEEISILLIQLATLYRGSEVIPMSTRGGKFITLKEVMDEVGRDATRFFFLMRKANSHLDFDLELAKKTSFDNPVYYIQYAHARISNILEFAKDKVSRPGARPDPKLLTTDGEIAILKSLRKFPYILATSVQHLEPYFLISYLSELAAAFHSFYTNHRVVADNAPLSCARLKLVNCVKTVFSQGLSLLGVSAPTKM